jgi:hypothetical protein
MAITTSAVFMIMIGTPPIEAAGHQTSPPSEYRCILSVRLAACPSRQNAGFVRTAEDCIATMDITMKRNCLMLGLILFASGTTAAQSVNIALPLRSAVVTTSDVREYGSHQVKPGLLLDENPDTFWESQPTAGPKWVMVDLRFARHVTALQFDLPAAAPAQQFAVDVRDIEADAWRMVHEGELTSPGLVDVAMDVMTDRVRVRIDTTKDDPLRISDMRVMTDERSPVEPGWQGHWIWGHVKEGTISRPDTVRVRRRFHIDDIDALRSAFVQSSVDDAYKLYVNGHYMGLRGNRPPTVFDIREHLVASENVIALTLVDTGGAAGYAGEVVLNYQTDGVAHTELIPTDESWRYVTELPEGAIWTVVDYADDDWLAVDVMFDPPPAGPWGQIDYHALAFNPDHLFIESQTVASRTIKPGVWLTGELTMSIAAPIAHDYALKFELATPPPSPANADMRVAEQVIWPPTPTSAWQPGKAYRVPVRVWIDHWAPHGDVPITLTAVGDGRIARLGDSDGPLVLGSVHIDRLSQPPVNEPVDVQVRMHGDAPVMLLDGEPAAPVILTQFAISHRVMHEWSGTDIKLYRIGTGGNVITTPDKQDEVFANTVAQLEFDVERIRRYVPDAKLLLLVMLRTDTAWTDARPDELVVNGNGDRGHGHSLASGKWRDDASAFVERLVRHVEQQPWGGRVINYTFAAGGGGEFHHYQRGMGLVERDEAFAGDFSKPAIQAFRVWLRERYDDVTALRAAWRDDAVTFDTALPTSDRLVGTAEQGFFRDPAAAQDVIDYFTWLAHHNGQNLVAFCRAAKRAATRNVLCGGYYGYLKLNNQYPASLVDNGHGAFGEVIDDPSVNVIPLPYSYTFRNGATAFTQNSLPQSLHVRGKLFWAELDNRTWVSCGEHAYAQASHEETIHLQRRDIGASVCEQTGYWWLDFAAGTQGQRSIPWFTDPDVVADMQRSVELFDQQIAEPFETKAEIAVFVDHGTPINMDIYASIPGYNTETRMLGESIPAIGVPSDWYSLSDLKFDFVADQYKVYVFLNAYRLTAEQRQFITQRLQRDGKTLVWLWGSGYVVHNEGLSLDAMTQVTGMHFDLTGQWQDSTINLLADHPLTRISHEQTMLMRDTHISYFRNRPFFEKRLAPVFWPIDDDIDVVGRFAFNDAPAPGLAVRKLDDWTSVWCGIPYLDPGVLRAIAEQAGVHIYLDDHVASLHAGGRFISIHNDTTPLDTTLHLPQPCDVFDAFSGEQLGTNTNTLPIKIAPAHTLTLRLSR